MIKLDFSGFFDRKAVTDAVDKATRIVLSKFGAFVRTGARSSIRKRKKPSPPGQPPSSHVGLLRKFIFFAYEKAKKTVVIGPAKLDKPGQAPRVLEEGGDGYEARPYMVPSFKKEQPKLPQMYRDAVKP